MRDQLFSLRGKTALITGGAGLLGIKHAEAVLMAEGRVVLFDINPDAIERAASQLAQRFNDPSRSNIHGFVVDITDAAAVEASGAALTKQGIEVDILINNAARNPAVGGSQGLKSSNRLESLDLAAFQGDVAVGLTGALLCAKVFGTAMAQRRSGVIINVASDLGVIAPDQRLYRVEGKPEDEQDVKPVSYSIVKHGLIGLTKYLATYWAERGVRCNALSPGGVFNGQNEVFLSRINKLIPMGRMARADEYQGAIIFLASDASSYLNGTNLVVDGGRSVW